MPSKQGLYLVSWLHSGQTIGLTKGERLFSMYYTYLMSIMSPFLSEHKLHASVFYEHSGPLSKAHSARQRLCANLCNEMRSDRDLPGQCLQAHPGTTGLLAL